MTHTITDNGDGTTAIAIDFADEEIDLTAATKIIGDETKAAAYLSVFEADIRRINSHLFPQPENQEETEEEEE